LLLPSRGILVNFLVHRSAPSLDYGYCIAPLPCYQIRSSSLTIHGRVSSSLGTIKLELESQYDRKPVSEKRTGRRARIARPVRVRPSESRDDHSEDLPISINASKSGIYFTNRLKSYYPAMRIFVTFPYS
jgi:hypothetical protein